MDRTPTTTAEEVVRRFVKGGRAKREFDTWVSHPKRQHVPRYVMQHQASAVYRIASQDIKSISSEHALGRIRPEQGYAVAAIKNWRPDFAFTHIFHYCAEGLGGIFTYGEFREFCTRDSQAFSMINAPAQEIVRAVVQRGRCSARQAETAMKWRIGLFYYSFLREMYVIARLRELGLDVRTHPLADALFRADGWCGGVVLSLYVRNAEFRDGGAGRKLRAREILTDGQELGLSFVELAMEVQRKFGIPHFPGDGAIEKCSREISLELDRRAAGFIGKGGD